MKAAVKALKICGISLLVLLLLIILIGSYITMTHGGMQRLFSLGSSYVQGELQWSELQGSLIGPAEIADLQYDGDDGSSVKIDSVRFDWHPRNLIRRQVKVEKFSAEGIAIRLPKPVAGKDSKSAEPFQLNDLRLPVGVEINELSLSDIRVYPYGSEKPIVIDSVNFGGGGQQSDLRVVELSAKVPGGGVKIDGVVNTTGNWPMSLTAAWQYEDVRVGPLQGHATASGNLDELLVNHELLGAIESTTELTISDVTGEVFVSGVASVTADNLGLLSPAAENMPLKLNADLSGNLSDLTVDAKLTSEHETTGSFSMDVSAFTDQKEIQVKQFEIKFDESPWVITANGDVVLATQVVDLDIQWSEMAWPLQSALQSGPVVISDSSGELRVQGSADSVTINGVAVVDQLQAGLMDVSVDVVADPKRVLVNSVSLGGVGTDTSLDVSGVVSVADNRVDLNGSWENLRWPLTASAVDNQSDFESRDGRFSVIGPLSNYQLHASLDAGGRQIPQGKWIIRGIGNESAFSDLRVAGETLDGKIEAVGTAGWSPQPEWDFDINARGINPESQWSGFDASVDADIKSSGIVTSNGLSQSTEIIDIGGTYKGQPLDGSGGVSLVNGDLVVDSLRLVAGSANITASGKVGNEVDLQWQIEAPTLEALVPGFTGELQISGDHSGQSNSMGSQIAIKSAQIDSDFLKIADLNGTASVDLSGKNNSNVELRASDVFFNGRDLGTLAVSADGTPLSHAVSLQLNGSQGNIELAGEGVYTQDRWDGTLTDFSALATVIGDWTLEQPVQVVAGREEVRFRDLCVSSNASTVCAALARGADGTVDAEADLQNLDITRFSQLLPPDIGVDIDVNGQVKANIDKKGRLVVSANAEFPDGMLRYLDSGIPVQSPLGKSEITANIVGNTVDAIVDVDLQKLGFVKLDVNLDLDADGRGGATVTDTATDTGQPIVNGRLNSEITDLSLIGAFVPDLESVNGVLKSNLAFSGALDAPRITGNASVDKLSLAVPAVAVEVTDGTLQITGNGRGGLLLRGSAWSGDGQLELDGNYSATSGALEMDVGGKNFRVSNTSRQQIEVSPELKIRFADRKLVVNGDVLIPTALIKTGGGSSVIVESPDVVIIDSSEVRREKKQNDIDLNVQVLLGNNIRVDAGQFDGALSGGLTINKKPGQVTTGSGTIDVVSGDFLVYGQKLTMERGRILFSGGPIDDPVLDLDVARDVPEYKVKAGVRVSGSAQTPILELNSNPPQTDANTLSFILLGKPVDALGASYTLGRYISPELYVSFGFDLFDRREIFTLRYQLSDRLSLTGSSSISREPSSGADLVYTLER